MANSINLGMFGMGNVGMGIVRLLSKNQSIIDNRVGKPVQCPLCHPER